MEIFETKWQAPSNIALIKYWGKHGNQLPGNPSLSITLSKAVTTTLFKAVRTSGDLPAPLDYRFEGRREEEFEKRMKAYLEKISPEFPPLNGYHFLAESSNTFPHSAGIASSASSMAAMALCLCDFEQHLNKEAPDAETFFRKASVLARLGSGSASRSVYGNYVTWGQAECLNGSSDEFASPYTERIDPLFKRPGVAILVASSKKKSLSSSSGHQLMSVHPFAKTRYMQAHNHLAELLTAMKSGDFEKFARIVETEALTLHSLLMTSAPEGLLLKPASLQIIEAVRNYRSESGVPLTFTLDAGPNVLLIYPHEFRNAVIPFIEDQLVPLCENGRWLDDMMGEGPVRFTND